MGRQPPRDITFTITWEWLCSQDFVQNDPTGTACFGTGRKVASDDASIPDSMCGDERRFRTGVCKSLVFRTPSRFDSHFQTKASLITRNVRFGSCVDGSPLARVNLTFVQIGRVQSCVRPVDAVLMTAGPNAIRGSGPNHKRALVKRPDPNGFSRPPVRPILQYLTFTPPNSSPPMSQLHSWAAPLHVVHK